MELPSGVQQALGRLTDLLHIQANNYLTEGGSRQTAQGGVAATTFADMCSLFVFHNSVCTGTCFTCQAPQQHLAMLAIVSTGHSRIVCYIS